MFVRIHVFLVLFLIEFVRMEDILLPLSSMMVNNQSSSLTSIYLCHVYQLNHSKDLFIKNYDIINQGNTGHVHHLLLYECSSADKLIYSGLCGKDNARLMPQLVYRHCQTRIIIAWAKGGQLNYTYPTDTGLKILPYTQFLLEVHFEPSIPQSHSIGIHLEFYPNNAKPHYEIGVLTLGTLAKSPLYLPPGLNSIRFPTYCFNDCLKDFLKTNLSINIYSILVHAHKRAIRIQIEDNYFNRLLDQNPFNYHSQKNIFFSKPYPQLNSTHELSLICYYSTKNDFTYPIYGGHNSNNEMCQAFIYYYPKIPSFPLCLSLPLYNPKTIPYNTSNWTYKQSLFVKHQLESNENHLSMCGDNIFFNNTNQTMLTMKIYQRSIQTLPTYSLSSFYSLILLSIIFFCLFIKKYLHSFSNGGTL